ncbi:MAG: choice-of-anchor L domain-containing protein [Flavobacteriales bacterium]|nr:choice-of-anchor L domain-containing protein [Flavobacteriales bacterium]
MRPLLLVTTLLVAVLGHAQLVLDGSMSPTQLVQDVLLGPGVTVSNVTFNGSPANAPNIQVGRFDGGECVLQLDNGLLLCTGGIDVALGPNNTASGFSEVNDNFFADNDLDNVAGDMTMDIACIEFDFVPGGDSISFDYSFASEEYLEYVNAGYNDAFGFFLSGPGIFGPFDNDAVNLAVVPGSFSYVSVNSVHPGSNAQYYQDNGNGSSAPFATSSYYIQFDGFTRGLTARAHVQCGQTYHIKLAIGDVGDPNWDSGVFILGGTFASTGGASLAIATSTGSATVMEGCDAATVTLTRSGSNGAIAVPIQISGEAFAPADVSGVPATVSFADGQTSVSFPISFVADGSAEGPEELTICATIPGACGGGAAACASIIITDATPISIAAENAVSDCSGAMLQLEAVATGGNGDLSYAWSNGSQLSFITVPDNAAVYTVTVTDACGAQATADAVVTGPCGVVVPNVITPNNDGMNDAFVITGIEYQSNHVRISNRWGQVVFETDNYRNNWSGGAVSDGTYYYEVFVAGQTAPLTGHLTILSQQH